MDDSCQVGNTPEVEMGGIIFKREDLNPSGSVKDRGISYQLNWAKKEGIKNLILSSSGNAAISACFFGQKLGLELFIFVSPKTDKKKLAIIKKYSFRVFITNRPISDSIKFAKKNNFYHLRPSTDPRGTVGYREIAREILESQGNQGNRGIGAVFIPVSSGTTLMGVAEGFRKSDFLLQLHIVQTAVVCPLAGKFDKDFVPAKLSLASALVAKYVPKKQEIIQLVKDSGGWGWVVSDEEIVEADGWLKERGVATSFEGAASLAAVWKAKNKGWNLGKTVCLLTGRRY